MTEDKHLYSPPESNIVNSKSEDLRNTYRFETERIETFSLWKIDCPVDPVRLAKAGFYYSGNGDEVICFCCKGHIKNWNYGDIVQKRHSELFPNCDFVNNRSNNVPANQTNKMNDSHKNGTTSSSQQSAILGQTIHPIDFNQMKSLQERLKSYALSWPLPCINIRNMADAGFFYLGYEDKVQCPFCKGIVSNWKVGDVPIKEHVKHFPHCNYLCNILSTLSLKTESCMQEDSIDLCDKMTNHIDSTSKSRLLDKNQEHMNLKKLGVLLHSVPASPQHASFNSRLRSFASWPVTSPVSKEYLAKAGFFYIGIKDHTKCFHCDGGLCNWELGDDPWVEHARWFRNCGFLHLNKGASFTEECITRCSNEIDVPSQTPHMLSETLMIQVDEAMKSIVVKNVLETTAFPPYIIRAAVLRQIKETGSSFFTKDDLCFAVTFLKNEMEKKPLQMDSYHASDFKTNYADLRKCVIDNDTDGNNGKLKKDVIKLLSNDNTKQNLELSDEVASICKDQYLCIICMEQKVSVVFLPCGHLLACTECASALKLCAMCRKTIQATVRAYLP